ncbi:hypothetical protein LTR17_003580 [Elasticomyces elasticus]|nr:hypothetical protein LTR17_003580 [Elasticomyces elasticus]
MPASTDTAAAPQMQLQHIYIQADDWDFLSEGGKRIAEMSQQEIDALMARLGYKEYTRVLEEQIRDDIKKKTEDEKSSLKIRIELNLDVEVHLTARVKGDIVIGLL